MLTSRALRCWRIEGRRREANARVAARVRRVRPERCVVRAWCDRVRVGAPLRHAVVSHRMLRVARALGAWEAMVGYRAAMRKAVSALLSRASRQAFNAWVACSAAAATRAAALGRAMHRLQPSGEASGVYV